MDMHENMVKLNIEIWQDVEMQDCLWVKCPRCDTILLSNEKSIFKDIWAISNHIASLEHNIPLEYEYKDLDEMIIAVMDLKNRNFGIWKYFQKHFEDQYEIQRNFQHQAGTIDNQFKIMETLLNRQITIQEKKESKKVN